VFSHPSWWELLCKDSQESGFPEIFFNEHPELFNGNGLRFIMLCMMNIGGASA
jgi:hypothetical protein